MFDPIKTLNRRLFKQNTGRNLVAVIAILLTTLMFTTLFTLARASRKTWWKWRFVRRATTPRCR